MMVDSKDTLASRHKGANAHVNSQWLAAGTISVQATQGPRTKKVKGTLDPAANQDVICNLYPLAKGKLAFSTGVPVGMSYLPPCQEGTWGRWELRGMGWMMVGCCRQPHFQCALLHECTKKNDDPREAILVQKNMWIRINWAHTKY